MTYNKTTIMTRAWEIFRKYDGIEFAEALHRAWNAAKAVEENALRIELAKAEAGITEEVKTWSEWHKAGFEVIHGSKALFGVDLIWASKGDGAVYKARFFGASQVQELTEELTA